MSDEQHLTAEAAFWSTVYERILPSAALARDLIAMQAREIDDRLLMLGRAESRDSGATPHADAATRALVVLVGEARRLEREVARLTALLADRPAT